MKYSLISTVILGASTAVGGITEGFSAVAQTVHATEVGNLVIETVRKVKIEQTDALDFGVMDTTNTEFTAVTTVGSATKSEPIRTVTVTPTSNPINSTSGSIGASMFNPKSLHGPSAVALVVVAAAACFFF